MIIQTVFFLWLYFPLAKSNEQLDCNSLGIGTNPFSGNNLPYCQTDMLQCCTDEYLRGKEAGIRMNLTASLKEELLSGNFEILSQIVIDLENFYRSDFFPDFASRMPLMIHLSSSSRAELINSFSNNLTDGLNSSNTFNYGPYFDSFFNMVKDKFIDDYLRQFTFTGTITTVHKNCLRNLLTQRTNSTLEQTIDTKMDKLLLYYTTTNRIKDWYERNFIALIEQTGFPSQCVPGFIALECAACLQTIPPLCQSVCSHITQGCYSPFKQGLTDQLSILWNATRLILDRIESTLPEVYSAQQNLLPIDFDDDSEFMSFASAASAECGILLSKNIFGRRRRSLNSFVMLPKSIIGNATLLNGSFSYDGRLPHFCNSNSGGRCWNGNNNQEMDNMRTDFDDSIENQDLNPVVSFNRTELVEIAQSLGTPVSNFLESALTGLDIEVPMGQVFQLMIEERAVHTSSVSSVMPTVSESLMISPTSTSTSSGVRMSTSSTYRFPSPTTTLTATDGGSLHYCSFYMILILLVIFIIA
ncbi:PREDICTED: uncharacterized protein LOC109584310 [Amphimedon queenslandica]|nr:PREDICTED: uncharacterized protein LOC109584310 [Amphimedon queenslandica]|eukprot:XP_019855557.1 PREDICTED: uncharacterized protein LOC109584310 [Amphimedon queenslandica]